MRLQSAIFTLGDTLFTPDGAAREGLDKALSLFKMEGVWLGAVTALLSSFMLTAELDDAATRHAEPCAVQRIAVRFCVNFGKTTGFDVFLVLVAVFLNCDIVRI